MAEALVSFGIQKLWDLLSQKYEQFQGVEDQVTELKSNLLLLKSFLKDADAEKHTSAVVRHCVEEIKEIVYDAEDIIEIYLLKEELGKTSIMKRIRRRAFIIPYHLGIASNMGGISKRITKVILDMQSFGVQQIMSDDGYMQPLGDRQRAMRQTFPVDYERDFVGLEANVKKLVRYFVEEKNIQIVSITGMGGLGKTTLARQVFNHEDVKHNFDGLAWVCVSQDFSRMHVWQKILVDLKPKEEENKILEMTQSTLQGELIRLLETSKSLIVLDDIWKEEDWDLIKPIFQPKKGWKVLLTSRNESVVMHKDTTYINFKPECLNHEDSWELFQRISLPRNDAAGCIERNRIEKYHWNFPSLYRQAFTSLRGKKKIGSKENAYDVGAESKVDEEMEEMGKQMIKHCGGLPLAVRVLGGLLAAKYTLHYWKQVSENIGSHLVERTSSKNGSIDQVLSLSFEELPISLKYCFLYLAHFPEDHKINIEDLSYYWAAEGVFDPRHDDGETIRDVGDSYIEELVARNMVISRRDVTTLRYETCHLHDMMREICLSKAKEENFLQIATTSPSTANSQSPFTPRRFVSQYPTTLDVKRDINNPKLRSLMVVQVNDLFGEGWKLSGSSFKRLELLRVLDLFKAEFEGGKLPSGIGKLIHLRYLSLKKAKVYHLPSSLGNLLLLIYLNLDILGSISVSLFGTFVPNVLMGMQELRYLALPRLMDKKTKLELSNLVNLETLKNFKTENGRVEDLCCMVRLRSLSMELNDETSIETLSASIGGMRNLEDLKITYDFGSNQKLEEGIVLDFSRLTRLSLSMYTPNLLREQHFSSHLTIISLQFCYFEEDPMPILEKLLQLKEVTLHCKSFIGKRMVCSGSGFPQLQKLNLYFLEEWEEWIVEEGSMSLLHTLYILGCKKLKGLPDGLRFITSLKELEMDTKVLAFKEKISTKFNTF